MALRWGTTSIVVVYHDLWPQPLAPRVNVQHAEAVAAVEARVGGREWVTVRHALRRAVGAEVAAAHASRLVEQAQRIGGAPLRVRGVHASHVPDLRGDGNGRYRQRLARQAT